MTIIKLQNVCIKILNSNYKFLFSFFVCSFIYNCSYIDSNLALCMNENLTSEYWKALFYASQEKVRQLEIETHSLQEENLDLNLENFRLTNELATEKTILNQALVELINTKNVHKELKNQIQDYTVLTREICSELSEAKTEINILKQKYEHIQDSYNTARSSKKPRQF